MHIQRNALIALRLHQIGILLPFAVLHEGQTDFRIRLYILPGNDIFF